MEFHISRSIREKLDLNDLLFSYTGNVVFADVAASRKLAHALTLERAAHAEPGSEPPPPINAGALFAMGLIDELSHALIARYRKEVDPDLLTGALSWLQQQVGPVEAERLLLTFADHFPAMPVFRGEVTAKQWLEGTHEDLPNREAALEELLLLWLSNSNQGFAPFRVLFEDQALEQQTAYKSVTATLPAYFSTRPPLSPQFATLLEALRAPMLASPDSLTAQLDFIREHWLEYLSGDAAGELRRALRHILLAIDVAREEEQAIWLRFHPPVPGRFGQDQGGHSHGFVGDEYVGFDEDFVVGPDGVRRPRQYAADHQAPLNEYEAFSQDQAWMPNVVLMAKSTYVWLEQLSKKYGRHIHRLDHIPEEELKLLAGRGITGLWLIGLWERSIASKTIKNLRGQTDAVASAYSLKEYKIAEDLGGQSAYETLRDRASHFGLRLASDMVPNHMGIDSTWVIEHPDWFISRPESPFPSYTFEGPDLSPDSRVEIKIEDHYFDQTDAAVVFRLRHHRDGSTRFVYHGNDGTTFAWNDTAQLDYSQAFVREEVIQTIFQVARLFPIIRFDAAMTLAKRHVQRLWFPLPGVGGSIPSRAESAMSNEEFDALMPHEFWREVVDRVAVEVPGTLLLAEAFWLLEGYFVRTLGMHRVYNSAFMNMLRDEENAKYRSYLKKTIEFDPDILKRYVNFMSNPDERTAIDQFGDGDKFFGTCTLLATLPGLPMFGHGQIEGFTERYGMEFKRARMDENPNEALVARHQHEIAPLLKNRWLFAESTHFVLYDFWNGQGAVDENVFAYSNRSHGQRALVLYNNVYASTRGTIHFSAASMDKGSGELRQRTLLEGLDLPAGHEGHDGLVLSFRDPVRNLHFLRRARDFAHNGLTVSLPGYGHVVYQDWRELRSTAQEPWDRLADSLHGAGVGNLHEAVSRLRLHPVHDALREALSYENAAAFAQVAHELAQQAVPEQAFAQQPLQSHSPAAIEVPPSAASGVKGLPPLASVAPPSPAAAAEARKLTHLAEQALPGALALQAQAVSGPAAEALIHPLEPVQPASSAHPLGEPLDPRLRPFFEKRALFFAKASDLSGRDLPAGSTDPFIEALRLPALFGPASPPPAPESSVLPLTSDSSSDAKTWAPVLAFLLVSDLATSNSPEDPPLFESLHLHHALGEAFTHAGLHGEHAWRAAGRVRLLLSLTAPGSPATPEMGDSEALWNQPDARWLAGANEAGGTTYVNRERFADLLLWLQLPALLDAARPQAADAKLMSAIQSAVSTSLRALEKAGYRLTEFLVPVTAPAPPEPVPNSALEPVPGSTAT